MKTVMKKMFSLLMVAVLLVGVMPFQAFAAEETLPYELTLPAGEYSVDALAASKYSGSSTNYWVHRTAPTAEDYKRGTTFTAVEGGTYTLYVVEQVADSTPADPCVTNGHTPGAAATCTTNQECTVCHEVLEPATGHTPGAAATCTTAQICNDCRVELAPATGHTPGAAATCTTNQECTVCHTVLTNAGHTLNSNGKCTVCGYCNSCNQTPCACYVTVAIINELKGTQETRTVKPGDTISLSAPAWVDGYEPLGWKLSTGGDYLGSSYTVPANAANGTRITINAKYKQTTTNAKYSVNVYARLKIGDEVQDVDLIHSHNTLLENDKILSYLTHADTMADLRSKIANKYPDYTWSGSFYNAYGDKAATDNITTVNGSKSVYINLYAEQDQVLLYVYTHETCETHDYLYELDGYKANSVNDTVTSSDVRSFLKEKFGSGISIKMFDEEGFEGYWKGKENTSTNYVAVKDGTTKIHVRLYNAYSSSSSSSKADSSNPKTGDMIFDTVVIMTASASALATLFYLNKKRAI